MRLARAIGVRRHGKRVHASMRPLWLVTLLVIQTVAAAAQQSTGLAGFGIVILHGKGGQPGGLTASLAAALTAAGATVEAPAMAWKGQGGRPEAYVLTYEQALAPIASAIARLKAAGASRIVLAGHSLGANAAIGFAARHPTSVSAVIALSAGHTPERMQRRELVAAVAEARRRVAAGEGDRLTRFPDLNQGDTIDVQATPKAYLSFFDPKGPAVIPRNAAAMPAVPLLWVIGRNDPLSALGRGYAFAKAPSHPQSKYLEVDAGHRDAPDAARAAVLAWLSALATSPPPRP